MLAAVSELMADHDLAKAPEAYELLLKAESAGCAEASYAIGTWYLFGFYLKKNVRKAVQLFRKAAKEEVAAAAFDLAVCYEQGQGVRRSELKAISLMMRAFALGDLSAGQEVERLLYWGDATVRNRSLSREFGRLVGQAEAKLAEAPDEAPDTQSARTNLAKH
jgi:uncharacterized protein